jgi:hypothetical protein
MSNWLENLGVGDRVIISRRNRSEIRTVDRITKTQVIVAGMKFNRSSGSLVGNRYSLTTLVEYSTELRLQIELNVKRKKVAAKAYHFLRGDCKHLTSEQCDKLLEVLDDL